MAFLVYPSLNGACIRMGTELANVFTFDFGGGLIADFGASVLFTGDFYKTSPAAPRPDNLYEHSPDCNWSSESW